MSEQDIQEFQRIADEMAERHAQAEAREFELGRRPLYTIESINDPRWWQDEELPLDPDWQKRLGIEDDEWGLIDDD